MFSPDRVSATERAVHEQAAAAPTTDRRRTSVVVTSIVAAGLIAVSILFAANTEWYFVFKMLHVGAAVVWVGGGLFITICAVLANDDDRLLQIGHWAETVASRLFPVMSFVVLGFGIGMTQNLGIAYDQFWLIFGLVAWVLSAATGVSLGPESKRLNRAAAEHGPKSPQARARLRRILLVVRVDVALMFLGALQMDGSPGGSTPASRN